ncbi:MAG: ABC transporter permease [Thermodesulfobacteriota bacterium]|nr:ABC transporter permease [Thermodesulfobacteriota bacterium]
MNFYPIFKKELKSYFGSMMAYIVVAVFLAVFGHFFYSTLIYYDVVRPNVSANSGILWPLFTNSSVILLFIVPLLTMRVFSEEKKLGTIEVFFTYPLRDAELLLGKFAACLGIFSLMLLLTSVCPILLSTIYELEIMPIISGYLGLFLMGAAFISLGILISALTENQIVAAMVTCGLLFIFWSLAFNEYALGTTWARIINHLSFLSHHRNFVKGIIETKAIVYFLNFNIFCLTLTLLALQSKRWRGLR